MDTRFLESFVAAAECGSVAGAARRLNVAPATLALRIRALEDELGFPLTTRAGRTTRPTPAGAEVARRAGAILRDLRALRSLGDEEQPRGQLRLGVAQTAIATVLCDVLPALARQYPDLEIGVQKGSSAQVLDRLGRAEVDGGILFHPPFRLPKDLVWRPLRAEPYVVIAPAAEACPDPLRLLRERPLVRYDRSLWSGQIAENYLRRHRIRPNERVELDALDAIAVLVHRGLGVALVPDRALPWPEGLALRKVPLPEPSPRRELGLVWPIASAYARLMRIVERETVLALGGERIGSGSAP